MTFAAVWRRLQQVLQPGLEIPNWTIDHGLLGDSFTVAQVAPSYIEFTSPDALGILHVPASDFERVHARWLAYKAKEVRRSEIRDVTRFSKYILSTLHWLDVHTPQGVPASETNSSEFDARLDSQTLQDACEALARAILGEGLDELSRIDALSRKLRAHAEDHVDFVIGQGRDPNIIVRIVRYLGRTHAIPPMGDRTAWFEDMLQCLLELAVPNGQGFIESELLYQDIEEGIAIARSDYSSV
jgi:hypothetical protein